MNTRATTCNTTGVLMYDVSNHPVVKGHTTSYHISINLWHKGGHSSVLEAADVADFAIHRFAPFTPRATRRQLSENNGGQALLKQTLDAKHNGTVQRQPASLVATVAHSLD